MFPMTPETIRTLRHAAESAAIRALTYAGPPAKVRELLGEAFDRYRAWQVAERRAQEQQTEEAAP